VFNIRIQTLLSLGALGVVLLILAVLGRYSYVNATTTPIHPDSQKVPSVRHSEPAPRWAAAVQQAERSVRTSLADQNLPGVSVAVGVGGEIAWAEGFGWADLDNQLRVGPDTRFRAGDVSRALTSIGVGLLLEANKLALDDRIQKYVPEFPEKRWPVTLRQLMGQVAGVRNDEGDEESLASCENTLDGVRRFAKYPLQFEPGTRFGGSSYSWILVSAAVEKAAGERFSRFMRAQVFEPAGMVDTRPDSASEPIPRRATFYFPRFAGDTKYGPEAAREGDHSCFAGAGAFLSTPTDLVRFAMAVNSGTLVQPATLQTLQTPLRLPSGEETGYALGWEIETLPLAGAPARMAGHGTQVDFIGTTTYLMTFPDRGIVVSVMSNTSFGDAKSIAHQVAEAFAGVK